MLGWRYLCVFEVGATERRHYCLEYICDRIVRYFIPFSCEPSCKPFHTSHTGKPLTK